MDAITPLRCPQCRAFAWARDGFALAALADGSIDRHRVAPSSDLARGWSCQRCAYEVPRADTLHRRLHEAQVLHLD